MWCDGVRREDDLPGWGPAQAALDALLGRLHLSLAKVHTTGLVRDANGTVTHYVINDTGTGTSGPLVPADQFHQSLDPGPAVVTDAPIRTPTAARDAAPTVEDAPASPEGTTVPRDAAVSHSFEYGESAESKAAGSKALQQALQDIQGSK